MTSHCRKQWLNCPLGICYLLYRRKVNTVLLMKNPVNHTLHLAGLTQSGHLMHFRRLHLVIGISKVWFVGRFDGIRKGKIESILGKRVVLKIGPFRNDM